jgi:hypothetical protein
MNNDKLTINGLLDGISVLEKDNTEKNLQDISDVIGSWPDKICEEFKNSNTKEYAFYHKPTKLWVYFLSNYDERQVISLGLKNNCTTFIEKDIEHFIYFLKNCSFNSVKNYARDNFLEFEIKEIKTDEKLD